jgi:uncharacterized protein YraI
MWRYLFPKHSTGCCGWTLVLVVVLAGVLTFAPHAAAREPDSAQLTVVAAAINVRSGPDVTYPAVAVLNRADEVPVIGRDTATGWWQVQLSDGRTGWVTGLDTYVSVSGNTTTLQEEVSATGPVATTASTSNSPSGGTMVVQTVSGGPIYVVEIDASTGTGSDLRDLTTGMDPVLSPNGQQVAFTRWDDTQPGAFGSLWVINIDGSGERAVLGQIRQPKTPVWSPDGTQIVVSMVSGGRLDPEYVCFQGRPPREAYDLEAKRHVDHDGEVETRMCGWMPVHTYWGLRRVDATTGKFQDLPNDLYSYAPAWDPVNDWHVVFDGDKGLVNLDLNTSKMWALTDDANDHLPIYSPDGSKIAVSYWQSDHWEVHVLNADGSGHVRLTKTSARAELEQMMSSNTLTPWNNGSPVWSPDGSQIAFLTDRTGHWEIWIMNADGSNQHALLSEDAQASLNLQYSNMNERALSWR